MFQKYSGVFFTDNKARNGTIYSEASCNVTFKANCKVGFDSNLVTQHGAAIYSVDNSCVIFSGYSEVTLSNNVVSLLNTRGLQYGGTIYLENNCNMSFEQNSFTMFDNNSADFGAAIFSFHNSCITFKHQSKVIFYNNIGQSCGALTSVFFSNINFNDNSTIMYNSNTVSYTYTLSSNDYETSVTASAMCTFQKTDVTFSGYSVVTYTSNTAGGGGAVVFSDSNVIMKEYSTVTFNNNIALYSSGGALTCYNDSNITIMANSNVTFNTNKASQDGGAIYSYNTCNIMIKDNSTSSFINNTARNNGGAMLSNRFSAIKFDGNVRVTFNDNTADNGGVFYLTSSTVVINQSSTVLFYNNLARQSGGVGYFSLNSEMIIEGMTIVRFDHNTAEQNAGVIYSTMSVILFKGNSSVMLIHNRATLNGGAILSNDKSNITLSGNSVLTFANNEVTQSGGAGYFTLQCNFIMKDNAVITFDNNRASQGGAICIDTNIKLTFKGNFTALFHNNFANEGGGAVIVLKGSTITIEDRIIINFTNNSAQYGGAIFLDATATVTVMVNNSIENYVNFKSNIARVLGSSVYQYIAECLNSTSRITGINNKLIATPPNEVKFSDPAKCIDNDDTQCSNYIVQNIMLGSEIAVPVCVLDYYNQSVDSTQFLVQSEMLLNYFISGPTHVLISCDMFERIRIIGNQSLLKSINFTITIKLNTALYPNWKQISVNLIIELSSCHPGFWQYLESKRCECYNADDIVFCSGSNSIIKRGYWFGNVTSKPTVTFCPVNYCNFTCCETSNGYYHLSPARNNQCTSHRSGIACSSCTDGYTLSFDSTECVSVDSCTAGQTALVILLTVIYWLVMVTLVFAMMYCKVGIGYLYSITYYYSIVDILLNQSLQASRGLYLTVNIMSSFSKITPQFLGELCLTTGMSGIDQQFIHYIHPSAIILILVLITLLARRSRKISEIISRGIIHVICLLLLLSYTSIASTSLLLMRSLTFHGIDKVYTYLSPDILNIFMVDI